MISQDQQQLRRFYLNCWEKMQVNTDVEMTPLEQLVINVIREHPEYHPQLQEGEKALSRDYLPEDGEPNPFLHMSLHLGLHEQVLTDRPQGIQGIYQKLISQNNTHDAEHQMMQCLSESLWLAQQNQAAPDEDFYLEQLKKLLPAE